METKLLRTEWSHRLGGRGRSDVNRCKTVCNDSQLWETAIRANVQNSCHLRLVSSLAHGLRRLRNVLHIILLSRNFPINPLSSPPHLNNIKTTPALRQRAKKRRKMWFRPQARHQKLDTQFQFGSNLCVSTCNLRRETRAWKGRSLLFLRGSLRSVGFTRTDRACVSGCVCGVYKADGTRSPGSD